MAFTCASSRISLAAQKKEQSSGLVVRKHAISNKARYVLRRKCSNVIVNSISPEVVGELAESSSVALALGGSAAIAALSAALIAADPEKRRAAQMEQTGGDELAAVKNYFDTAGFERWRKIYGETDDVNKVQLDIRNGHAETVEKVLKWIDEEGGVKDVTVCDAGCGTGSLAIPLALKVCLCR
jgi:magnesium-protoporphyrin O-methyltransferase